MTMRRGSVEPVGAVHVGEQQVPDNGPLDALRRKLGGIGEQA
jgi:hypothetical protein